MTVIDHFTCKNGSFGFQTQQREQREDEDVDRVQQQQRCHLSVSQQQKLVNCQWPREQIDGQANKKELVIPEVYMLLKVQLNLSKRTPNCMVSNGQHCTVECCLETSFSFRKRTHLVYMKHCSLNNKDLFFIKYTL